MNTAKAQPAVIPIHQELLLFVRPSTMFATTPLPKTTSMAVLINSAK